MPPFVGRKRHRSPDDASDSEPPEKEVAERKREVVLKKKKPSLFDAVDGSEKKASLEANKKFLEQLNNSESSSLSEGDSDEFEDVLPTKKPKIAHEESDEDAEWEDALPADMETPATTITMPTGDLELTLSKNEDFSVRALTDTTKKGPSKIERQIRIFTHCMHVQFLMFHYLIRNGWTCDKKAQKTLVNQLPANLTDRVQKWRVASGISEETADTNSTKKQRTGKGKGIENPRQQRDWGNHAVRQEKGVPDVSHGDPLPRLLKELVAHWKSNFRITAPSLRKQGYKPMNVLQEEIVSYNNDRHDPEKHGERVRGRSEFRRCAEMLEGSRDTSAQLFVCLLRGLGIEARLVASLQPVGFGWGKAEEAPTKKQQRVIASDDEISLDADDDDNSSEGDDVQTKTTAALRSALKTSATKSSPSTSKAPLEKPSQKNQAKSSRGPVTREPSRRQPLRGSKETPIDLDATEHISIGSDSSELSDAKSISSEPSVEVLESTAPRRKPNVPFDRDMIFPNGWVEAISPVTHKVIPVDPTVSFSVVTQEEQLTVFEPRGTKADKAKQILAYVVAYNSDGTAKDVTTRYLKRRLWPGKTKGMRIPVEKVPVYNLFGKVKRYEQYDWFKRVVGGYSRASANRTLADELEDQTDLLPLQISKAVGDKPVSEIETLAGYKQSKEFVLERHLRRDEALLPRAKPVRHFTPTTSKSSKINTAKGTGESSSSNKAAKPEPVYRRTDVVQVKTAESWHKEGRAIIPGAQPLKTAPIRAVTLARKREVEEATRTHGKAPTQGLYSKEQTDWIVPEPIRDGVIPKNAYGTIDVFVPRMVPQGAAHVPYRGAIKACKKLGCDFAEAVVGFDFGNQRAMPITMGVVVAVEWAEALIEEIRRDQEAKRVKEEGKRTAAALSMWRKFIMGLRIIERVRAEYGPDEEGADERNPFLSRNKESNSGGEVEAVSKKGGKATAGEKRKAAKGDEGDGAGGGFVVSRDEDDPNEDHVGGGFLVEEPPNPGEVEEVEEEDDAEKDEDSDDDDEYED